MALTEITQLRNDFEFYGRINFEDLTLSNRFDAYELIQSDLDPYFTIDERQAAFVTFKFFAEITAFDPKIIQLYGGNPPRRRFGTYVFFNADTFYENRFLTYEKQMSASAKTFIVGAEDSPLTVFGDEATSPELDTWILLLNDRQTDHATPVSTGFEIDLNSSVTANLSISYSGQLTAYFDGSFFSAQTYVNI